jgi:hypothetical protein
MRYLKNHPDEWVSGRKLHALAANSDHGYTYETVEDALEAITHIPPYAIRSTPKDQPNPGRYYCFHTIDDETLETIKRGNDYFDSL